MNRLARIAEAVRFSLERGMSRADRVRWASAQSLADVGYLTAEWLNGYITQTPYHCGPPDEETIPHREVLAACNRAGLVTTNSQSAVTQAEAEREGWTGCEAWVEGFASNDTLASLRAALTGTSLVLSGASDRETFGDGEAPNVRWLRMARSEVAGFYAHRCPAAAEDISDAWWVFIRDPEAGRNDRLWPALAAFAAPGPLPVARALPRRHGEASSRGSG